MNKEIILDNLSFGCYIFSALFFMLSVDIFFVGGVQLIIFINMVLISVSIFVIGLILDNQRLVK